MKEGEIMEGMGESGKNDQSKRRRKKGRKEERKGGSI